MKITLKTAIICALLWIIVKTAYHLIAPDSVFLTPMILSNIFGLMASVSIGLYLHKRKEGFDQGNALSDIKAAMSAGVPYALIVSVYMFLYYSYINPNFVNQLKKPMIERLMLEISTDQKLNKLKKLNPELETKSKAEIQKMGMENIEAQVNPKGTSILSLLGMTLMATIYSIIIAIIYRKILVKGMA
jgi:hypothetical protein